MGYFTSAGMSPYDPPIDAEGQAKLDAAMDALSLPRSSEIPPTSDNPATIPAPTLPPALAAMHNKTSDEMLAELNKSPLFMTNLESDNNDLEALQALAYEGTPSEVALSFKEHGNECFKEQKWKDAKEFFSKGIQVLQVEVRKRAPPGKTKGFVKAEATTGTEATTDPTEIKAELKLLEACLSNRAACNLKLQNYRACTLDSIAALRINPKNIKCYFRSAQALLSLQKIPEADDACSRGLALDPSNKDLQKIADQIIKKNADIQAKLKKVQEAELKKRREEMVLKAALKARGIKMRKTAQPPEMEDAKVALVPDPQDPTSSLIFPTVLLYPTHLQSDFIKDFSELDTLSNRLQYILAEPMPWDTQGEFKYKNVECYMETLTGGLIKVGKAATLLKVLGGGNVEVVDDVVRIFVVPKAKAEAWVKDFKEKKAAEKGTS